jgi:hypothetical protein
MIRFDLFRALEPDQKYPMPPLDVKFRDVSYDLPLPPPVGDVFGELLRPGGPFLKLDNYCDRIGIDALRFRPERFEDEHSFGSYALSRTRVRAVRHGVEMGYVVLQAAASQIAATKITEFARKGRFLPEASDWITTNAHFLVQSGGFEMVRVFYYFNDEERQAVEEIFGLFGDDHLSLPNSSFDLEDSFDTFDEPPTESDFSALLEAPKRFEILQKILIDIESGSLPKSGSRQATREGGWV